MIEMPVHIMWPALAPRMQATVFGDNEAMLQVVKTGRCPSMRYLARTHRVSVAWLLGSFRYREAKLVAVDIFTTPFATPRSGYKLLDLFPSTRTPSRRRTLPPPPSWPGPLSRTPVPFRLKIYVNESPNVPINPHARQLSPVGCFPCVVAFSPFRS